jgi:hypothetical protein
VRRRVSKIRPARLAGAVGVTALALCFSVGMLAAAPVPAAQEILQRMLVRIAETPDVVSADAEFRLRVGKPLSEPPDCVFKGTAHMMSGQPTLKIEGRAHRPILLDRQPVCHWPAIRSHRTLGELSFAV